MWLKYLYKINEEYLVTHGCMTFDLELEAFKMNFIVSFSGSQNSPFKGPLPCKDGIFVDLPVKF